MRASIALFAVMPVLAVAPVRAQDAGAPAIPATTPATVPTAAVPRAKSMTLSVGNGSIVTLQSPSANIFIADPKVVQVRPASATALFVFGTGPGHTTVAAFSPSGAPVGQFDVTVRPSGFGSGEAARVIAAQMPGSRVHVETTSNGLLLTGDVASPAEAEQAEALAKTYVDTKQTVENRISVSGPAQVLLKVRIAEMSRTVTRQLGVDWQAVGTIVGSHLANPLLSGAAPTAQFALSYINPGLNVSAVIDALAKDNLARVLAEPNLTAISGQSADFLAGGQYPIPISQSLGTTTVQYKDYGVSLSFLPTVLSNGRISLKVRPEVSQLTTAGAVTVVSGSSSLSIPALTVRRADTTVELGSGQTLAIAGLLQDNSSQSTTGIPVIGDVPLLGGLFRSNTLQRDQSELVFLVTPYIVKPVDDPTALLTPGARFAEPPNDFERLFLMAQSRTAQMPAQPPPAPGDAGFLVE
jgi:pilus assembly protein CpaC